VPTTFKAKGIDTFKIKIKVVSNIFLNVKAWPSAKRAF
jgi:hypothetical protein